MPLVYGRSDCCLFVCNAIQAMTGVDVAAEFRGKYSTLAEARRFGTVREIAERITAQFSMPEVPVLRAQRGDVVLIKRRSYSLGLVDLSGRIAALTKDGLTRIPIESASKAWRV